MSDTEICGHLLARIETAHWDKATLDRYGILEVLCLYAIAYDGETTIDVAATSVRNEFIFYPDIENNTRASARLDLEYEGLSSQDYLNRSDVTCADSRFIVTVYADDDLDDNDKANPNWKELAVQEAYSTGATDEPAILSYDTWAVYDQERTAKRRSRNYPPIANWGANGLDNLPLFVAAANPILESRLKRAERLATRIGNCAAGKWQRKPLVDLNWSWRLPDPA